MKKNKKSKISWHCPFKETGNRFPSLRNRFLGSLKGLQIRALNTPHINVDKYELLVFEFAQTISTEYTVNNTESNTVYCAYYVYNSRLLSINERNKQNLQYIEL